MDQKPLLVAIEEATALSSAAYWADLAPRVRASLVEAARRAEQAEARAAMLADLRDQAAEHPTPQLAALRNDCERLIAERDEWKRRAEASEAVVVRLTAPARAGSSLRWTEHNGSFSAYVGRRSGIGVLLVMFVYRRAPERGWSARVSDAGNYEFDAKWDHFGDDVEAAQRWCVERAIERLETSLASLQAPLADTRIPAKPAL